ncbi:MULTISPECIES: hypothetical protein [unclassified Microbacterium]|uniref:Pepco domain-containing protein n=1 Tax=unclassified Microbacterium TaxID=2609290 RepID=UPI001AC9C3D7|nr:MULTISPECIES: hypothetical protein [unclassified Microbacterium]MBN9225454.1 hypothetical protein [Microbacterium sp.]
MGSVINVLGDAVPEPEPQHSEWSVDTIEVRLAFGAKGQVLFISEASAEASIKITLRRR